MADFNWVVLDTTISKVQGSGVARTGSYLSGTVAHIIHLLKFAVPERFFFYEIVLKIRIRGHSEFVIFFWLAIYRLYARNIDMNQLGIGTSQIQSRTSTNRG